MENTNKNKSYEWYLLIDEVSLLATTGEKSPSYVNEENKEAWRRYSNRVIMKSFRS